MPDITQIKSPNFGPRRHGLPPDMVVIHYTAMETTDDACTRLCDSTTQVSAHYLLSEQGEIIQLVPEDMRAWHAGAGAWGDVVDVNSHSIGIELANTGCAPFAAAQMDALEFLLAVIQGRWAIPAARIIGHSDMAPGRKFDPGPKFDWRRLASKGHSIWPNQVEDISGSWEDFQAHAKTFGYCAPSQTTEAWNDVLSAFRMRFLPHKENGLNGQDIAVIQLLAQKWPCAAVDLSNNTP